MQIINEHVVINQGKVLETEVVQQALKEVRAAIQALVWPPGAEKFSIHPESGKKRSKGNGVVPIRKAFVIRLEEMGWEGEATFPLKTAADEANFGKMDASKVFGQEELPILVEWETGNISSSHRSMNKMAIGLMAGVISAGILVVPTAAMAKYLTDRIGNERELKPYMRMWKEVPVKRGLLMTIAVEHDRTDRRVRRIKKGTDGRALL